MAHISCSIFFVLFSIFVVPIANGAEFSGDDVKIWPIWDPKDPKVVSVAKLIVSNHNKKANTNLSFVNVVKGNYAAISGVKHKYHLHLLISAKNGSHGHPETYDTSALYTPQLKRNSIKIYIFKKYKDNQFGTQPIEDLKDPKVMSAARFAVATYNTNMKTSLRLVDIVQGRRLMVVGVLYYLILSAKENNTSNPVNYEAVVWERLWLDKDALIVKAFRKPSKLNWN
ncbi:hypothetical protein ABFX02_04G016300 [Erythranthe guttata]